MIECRILCCGIGLFVYVIVLRVAIVCMYVRLCISPELSFVHSYI